MQDIDIFSQRQLVLQHLKKGRTITPLEALGEYSIYRLAPIINRLRNEGYNIKTTIKRSVRMRPYAEYEMVN